MKWIKNIFYKITDFIIKAIFSIIGVIFLLYVFIVEKFKK